MRKRLPTGEKNARRYSTGWRAGEGFEDDIMRLWPSAEISARHSGQCAGSRATTDLAAEEAVFGSDLTAELLFQATRRKKDANPS